MCDDAAQHLFFTTQCLQQRPDVIRKTSLASGLWQPRLPEEQQQRLQTFQRIVMDDIMSSWPDTFSPDPQLTVARTMLQPLHYHYSRYSHSQRNFSKLDMQAFRWLDENSDKVRLVDTDKNLGNALACSSWIHSQCMFWLQPPSVVAISRSDFLARLQGVRRALHTIVAKAQTAATITAAQSRFILRLADSEAAPRFRINVKVHKQPVGSRPICNNGQFMLAGAANFLVVYLQPLLESAVAAIKSSYAVAAWCDTVVLPRNAKLATYDIKSLYPMIQLWYCHEKCQDALYDVITAELWRYYSRQPALATLCCDLLQLILKNQVRAFNDAICCIIDGLSTGQQAAVVMPNIYMHWHDRHIQSMLGDSLYQQFRYIDDGLLAVHEDVDDTTLAMAINSWNDRIQTDEVKSGNVVVFLDLELSLQPNLSGMEVNYQTFRKPQNIYSFVPGNSEHVPSVFGAMRTVSASGCSEPTKPKKTTPSIVRSFWKSSLDVATLDTSV